MRAAIYIRVSTNQQEDKGMSLETQREGCLRLAQELGATHIEVFQDITSGTKGDRSRDERKIRPQYREMALAIDDGLFDVVIAHSSDRLSRDQNHLVSILDRIKEAGAEFKFVAEDADPSKAGFLIQYIRGYANSLEHERIRERSLRGKEAKLRAGKQFAQSTPFGYRWEGPNGLKERLVPDEIQSRIVRQMFQDVANGVSMRKVAQRLTEGGVQTRSGKTKWLGTTVRVILMNPVYDTGARTFFREGRSISGIDEIVIENACEPLVSKEIAAMARHRIATNQQASTRNNPYPERSLLRGGFIVCEACGKVLSVKNGKSGGPAYVTACCKPNRSINAAIADQAAWGVVKQLVEHPDIIRQALAEAKDPTSHDLESIDKQLKQYNSRYDKMMNLATLTDDSDVAQDFVTQATMLKKSIKALERDRVEVLKAKESWDGAQAQLADLTEWTEKMRRCIDELSYDDRRSLLTAFDIKVHLSAAGGFKGRTTLEETLARIRVSVGLDELLQNAIANTRCLTYHRNRRFSWTAHGLELTPGKETELEHLAA